MCSCLGRRRRAGGESQIEEGTRIASINGGRARQALVTTRTTFSGRPTSRLERSSKVKPGMADLRVANGQFKNLKLTAGRVSDPPRRNRSVTSGRRQLHVAAVPAAAGAPLDQRAGDRERSPPRARRRASLDQRRDRRLIRCLAAADWTSSELVARTRPARPARPPGSAEFQRTRWPSARCGTSPRRSSSASAPCAAARRRPARGGYPASARHRQ